MAQSETIGERVKTLRKKKGWTQEDLADRIHIERSSLKNKEKGYRGFSLDELIDLAEAFDCSLDKLVRGVERENIRGQRDFGLTDFSANALKEYREQRPYGLDGLNIALSNPAVLDALSRYAEYEPDVSGYYLSDNEDHSKAPLIRCTMSPELYKAVLGQNLLWAIDRIKENGPEYPFRATDVFSEERSSD